MIKLSELQRSCLHKMGITWFETRSEPTVDFLVCLDEAMSEEKQQLLAKMMVALRWAPSRYTTLLIADLPPNEALQQIKEKTLALQPKKRIVFSEREALGELINEKSSPLLTIGLPSLEKLLIDQSAKKAAWAKMQPLIEN